MKVNSTFRTLASLICYFADWTARIFFLKKSHRSHSYTKLHLSKFNFSALNFSLSWKCCIILFKLKQTNVFLNAHRSDVKLKPATTRYFSFFCVKSQLNVLRGKSHWLIRVFTLMNVRIGCCSLVFGSKKLDRKAL